MNTLRKFTYPFTAIVGQDTMKKALVLNAVNPLLGGVLIRGEKGTAKSIAVRGLAALLPEIEVVKGCPFGCPPGNPDMMCSECAERAGRGESLPVEKRKMKVIDLPVSATEDRVVGTLDIERAIRKGEKMFEPGLLAAANRGILYVDEVNLLEDHLVDVLLDAAAMGVNTVEREGVSYSHPARFILVGTMNPEEGELRPQLLDRFGLCVDVKGITDVDARVEIIRRRTRYEEDPAAFLEEWEAPQALLREKIIKARGLVPEVTVPEEMLTLIARIAVDMNVDGHRSDIAMKKAACTIAAYHGRREVTEEDVREAAELVLPHRLRRRPFQEEEASREKIEESIRRQKKPPAGDEGEESGGGSPPSPTSPDKGDGGAGGEGETRFHTGKPFSVRNISFPKDKEARSGQGRRTPTSTNTRSGRYVRAVFPRDEISDIAFDATIRAAAVHQKERKKRGTAIAVKERDIRVKVREKKIGTTMLFVVDSSGSMGAGRRMTAAKGAVLSLLIDAYQKRDRVGVVAFKGNTAEVLLPLTSSVELARRRLEELPTGGRTPLSRGLDLAYEILRREKEKHRDTIPFLVLVSDGKANAGMKKDVPPLEEALHAAARIKEAGIRSVVIDTEKDFIGFGLAERISEAMGGRYCKLEDLDAGSIVSSVRDWLNAYETNA